MDRSGSHRPMAAAVAGRPATVGDAPCAAGRLEEAGHRSLTVVVTTFPLGVMQF